MKGVRPSALEIAEKCSEAPKLGAKHGAGRAAFISNAMHAAMHAKATKSKKDARRAVDLYSALEPEEREELQGYKEPEPLEVGDGVILDYLDAATEVPLGLTDDCAYILPGEEDEPMTAGTADACWNPIPCEGGDIVHIADLKRRTETSHPMSLQLVTYAMAAALEVGASYFQTHIWSLSEGEWTHGDIVDLGSAQAVELFRRIKHACYHDSGYATGPHCSKCWSRQYCPEYLMPPEMAETSLAPFVGAIEVSDEELSQIVVDIARAKKTIAAVEENVKECVRRGSVVSDGNGMVYRPRMTKGRRTVALKVLEEGLGKEEAAQYIKQGKGYERWDWGRA